MSIPNVLSIAGSDPSGGAGIQADLKAFSALETYGMAAVVGLTAQNTRGVFAVEMPSSDFVAAQLHTIFDDIEVAAIKIGMLGTVEMIDTVADVLTARYTGPIVLDPVMCAKSGDPLLNEDAVDSMRRRMLPLATVLTPNLPEADALTGGSTSSRTAMEQSVNALIDDHGVAAVLLKGGALAGDEAPDLLGAADHREWLECVRLNTSSVHGAGCTLSASIAAYLAQGQSPLQACRSGKSFITDAIMGAAELSVGGGQGPTHALHRMWTKSRSSG